MRGITMKEYTVSSIQINNNNNLEVRDYINSFAKCGWKLISTLNYIDKVGNSNVKLFFEREMRKRKNEKTNIV